MQQTETYKLNLIESSDPFLPNALNENTQKIEEVVQEKLGEMDARVTVLEGRRLAMGNYVGEGKHVEISLGFNAKVLVVFSTGTATVGILGILLEGISTVGGLYLTEGGFRASNGGSYARANTGYAFFALG